MQKKEKDQLAIAPSSVGRYNSTRVDGGKKMFNSSRDKNEDTHCCSEEGEEGPAM